jgi:hypothetical protein
MAECLVCLFIFLLDNGWLFCLVDWGTLCTEKTITQVSTQLIFFASGKV